MPRVVIYQFETSKPSAKTPTSGIIRTPIITLTVPRSSARKRSESFTIEERAMGLISLHRSELHSYKRLHTQNLRISNVFVEDCKKDQPFDEASSTASA